MDPGASIGPRLAERLAAAAASDDVEVVIELLDHDSGSHDPKGGSDVIRMSFDAWTLGVDEHVRRLGGQVLARAWISCSMRATLPSSRVAELAGNQMVAYVELPSSL